MAVLCGTHHSAQRYAHLDQSVQVGVSWIHDFDMSEASDESPVIEYVAPTPAVTFDEPALTIEHLAPASAVTFTAPSSVIEYVASTPAVIYDGPAPMTEHVAPAPMNEYLAPASAVTDTVPTPAIEYVAPAPDVADATPAPVTEYVTHASAVTYATPAPVIKCATFSPVIEYATSASEPQIVKTHPFVNDTVPQLVEIGEVVSERVQQWTAEHSEGVPLIAEGSVEIEMPVPRRDLRERESDTSLSRTH